MRFMRRGVEEGGHAANAVKDASDSPTDPAAAIGRALVAATTSGPKIGLALLEPLSAELEGDYRLAAARAHLLELAGHEWDAVDDYRTAAQLSPDTTDERYLLAQASRLSEQLERPL